MSKVYVIQDMTRHDYSKAEEFGDVVFIGNKDINSRFGILSTPSNRQVLANMRDALTYFKDEDYLLCDGNPILFTIAVMMLQPRLSFTPTHILKWDNREHMYNVVDIPWDIVDDLNKIKQEDKENK